MADIFDLTQPQQKAFNRLKKAYKECEKLGVYFANRYGTLCAYDSNKISSFGTEDWVSDPIVSVYEAGSGLNEIKIVSEWADDDGQHYYGLTEEGLKIYNDQ